MPSSSLFSSQQLLHITRIGIRIVPTLLQQRRAAVSLLILVSWCSDRQHSGCIFYIIAIEMNTHTPTRFLLHSSAQVWALKLDTKLTYQKFAHQPCKLLKQSVWCDILSLWCVILSLQRRVKSDWRQIITIAFQFVTDLTKADVPFMLIWRSNTNCNHSAKQWHRGLIDIMQCRCLQVKILLTLDRLKKVSSVSLKLRRMCKVWRPV